MSRLSAGLEQYYREIADALPCSGSRKRAYLLDLRERLSALENEVPVANYEAAQINLGTVEEIVESWKEDLSVFDLNQRLRFGKRTKAMAAVFAAVSVGFVLLFGGFYVRHQEGMRGDFIAEGEVVVVKPEDISAEDFIQASNQEINERWEE